MTRYPFTPLAEAMRLTEDAACRALNISGSTAQEYRTLGMSERVAERLAVKAGWNPLNIWPTWGQEALARAETADEARMVECADEKCGERFLPARAGHLYCSTRCRLNRNSREWKRRRAADPEWVEQRRQASTRYRQDIGVEATRRARRLRYRANPEPERAARRARYAADPEPERARQRAYDQRRRQDRSSTSDSEETAA